MNLRPIQPADLDLLSEIDATIESSTYVHVDRQGEGLGASWRLHERRLRERSVKPNPIDDDRRLALKMVATGVEEGLALMAEHDDLPVALMCAIPDVERGVLRLVDVRVDFDYRRQGLASAMIFAAIAYAREQSIRAVFAQTQTDNFAAMSLMQKCGFELCGLDERRFSNHDLVKEAVTLFWYASLD